MLYYTLRLLTTTKEKVVQKHCRKTKNPGHQHFLVFPHYFLPKTNFVFCTSLRLSSANALKLDKTKVLSPGNATIDLPFKIPLMKDKFKFRLSDYKPGLTRKGFGNL